ncbi:EamA family transporter RarD [Salinisphaera sp. G21_0]|uniref:EamA family transporter RarD n=1 Tax=Salinisphaera sp. G21_0 TaxID=2821094 RepID=UPI001ADC59FB|nr:EamA family transporter RarD [Salinisphaera sp. G21_0]
MRNAGVHSGLTFAVGAFALWGLIPIYFKIVEQVSPLEVLAHRVFWSSLLLVCFLSFRHKLKGILEIIKSPRILGWLVLSSLFIAGNWLCFIWGVTNDRILETSLGYYINPLISVFFGYCFLGERLTRYQMLAVFIAAAAVSMQMFLLGKLPWVAFVLAVCFGFYGLIRKRINVDATSGLAIETLLLMPPAAFYFLWLINNDLHAFRFSDPDTSLLLALSGFVTTIPLVLFNMAAQKLSLTVLGIMQYLAPSISFLVGVTIYNEPLGVVQMATFALIWLALAIFTLDGLFRHKRQRERLEVPHAE